MTTTDIKVLYSRNRAQEQAIAGRQAPLYVTEAPASFAANLGKPLLGLTISANGDYVFLIPVAGLTSLSVKVTPQLTGSAALESAGPDALAADFNPRTTAVADGVVVTSGTGDGALADGTMQTASLTPLGAVYARYTLTHSGSGNATFDVAETQGA